MLYETPKNRKAQKEICDELVICWRLKEAIELSMAYNLDYALVEKWPVGSIQSYVEIKDRELSFGFPGGLYISLLKGMAARVITATTGSPCYLAARFDDGIIRVADFRHTVDAPVIKHGPAVPRRPFDIEPHCVIDWKHFRLLTEW